MGELLLEVYEEEEDDKVEEDDEEEGDEEEDDDGSDIQGPEGPVPEGMSRYEWLRSLKIKRNQERLEEIGLGQLSRNLFAKNQDAVEKKKEKKEKRSKGAKPSRDLPPRKANTITGSKKRRSSRLPVARPSRKRLAKDVEEEDFEEEEEEEEDSWSSEPSPVVVLQVKNVTCEEDGKSQDVPRKTRSSGKIKRHLKNENRRKNKNGRVEISRRAYSPERKLEDSLIEKFLGVEGINMSPSEKQEAVEWFRVVKRNCGQTARDVVIEEVVTNALRLQFGWATFEEIQDAWAAAAGTDDNDIIRDTGEKIIRLFTEGYFADRTNSLKKDWKYVLEKHLMDEYSLDYLEGEAVGKRDGCLARQANRARTDVLRRAMRQGKEKFDRIVSKRAAKLDEKGADYRKERRTLKKMDVTRWFIRRSEKKKSEGVAATSSSMMVASGSSAASSSSYTATSCSTSASWNSSSSSSRSAGSSSSSAGGSNNTESVKYYCLFVFLLFGQQRLCLTLCVWLLLLLLLLISKMS